MWLHFSGFILCCGIFRCGCKDARLLLLCLIKFFSTKPGDWLGKKSTPFVLGAIVRSE